MIEKPDWPPIPPEVRDYLRRVAEAGKYPSKGGKARAKKLTPLQRKRIASKGGKASAAARRAKKSEERNG
jgi:hypothetical protein